MTMTKMTMKMKIKLIMKTNQNFVNKLFKIDTLPFKIFNILKNIFLKYKFEVISLYWSIEVLFSFMNYTKTTFVNYWQALCLRKGHFYRHSNFGNFLITQKKLRIYSQILIYKYIF